ncbi:MAG: hypothetical protein GYA55_10710 [SAR324 cluster bacterium]|uniref:Uncharacterized protein n=1 Tax=SAR324 cluster bacterium TaxID=2024889 RepID=A0A7X9FSQ4_9DELT|nr:hypothetical protein [SAR324 cluster bacterium]
MYLESEFQRDLWNTIQTFSGDPDIHKICRFLDDNKKIPAFVLIDPFPIDTSRVGAIVIESKGLRFAESTKFSELALGIPSNYKAEKLCKENSRYLLEAGISATLFLKAANERVLDLIDQYGLNEF